METDELSDEEKALGKVLGEVTQKEKADFGVELMRHLFMGDLAEWLDNFFQEELSKIEDKRDDWR